MSENECNVMEEAIERILSRKLKPIYWAVGIMVAIFISVAAPLYPIIIQMAIESTGMSSDIEAIKKDFIPSQEAYKNFLPKEQYHILQKREHIADVEAAKHPEDSEVIWMKHNQEEAERLDIRYRGNNIQ